MTLVQEMHDTRAEVPARDGIAEYLLADEAAVVRELVERARVSPAEARETVARARHLVEAVRRGRRQVGGIDEFMQDYALSSEEGVMLMCLAEALLRIPDAATADKLNTGYGLTLGLHTRIERTMEEVRRRVRVGNLYANRNQIGAVVGAQPFGGEGLSGTGPKAGGPHYPHRFATAEERR